MEKRFRRNNMVHPLHNSKVTPPLVEEFKVRGTRVRHRQESMDRVTEERRYGRIIGCLRKGTKLQAAPYQIRRGSNESYKS